MQEIVNRNGDYFLLLLSTTTYRTACLVFSRSSVLHSEKEFHNAAKRNDVARMQELIRTRVNVKAKNNVGAFCFLATEGTLGAAASRKH